VVEGPFLQVSAVIQMEMRRSMERQMSGGGFFARTRAILWVFALFIGVSAPAFAGDIFTVTGVSVDATAESATAARDIAVREGERRALEILLKRLTTKEDWGRLPTIDGPMAESMVRSFQVDNERRSATHYLASLSVRFQPGAVRGLLSARDIPFSESPARTAVLIPILTDETGDRLWDEGNAWTGAWALIDLENGLTPMVVPLGDIGDMTTLTVQQALSGNRPALAAMAARYGADRVVVAHASVGDVPGSLSSRFVTYPVGEAGPKTWSGRESGAASLGTAAHRLASRFIDKTEVDWKRDSIVRFGEQAVLSASVAYQSLGEWQTIRRRLDQIPLIRNITIVAVSTEGAQVELDYVGTIDTLDLSLAQQRLALTDLDGYWYLAAVR